MWMTSLANVLMILAQSDKVSPAPDAMLWVTVVTGGILLLCIAGASIMPSKRTHRD